MKTHRSTFATFLADAPADALGAEEDEQFEILKKRLLIPAGVTVLLAAWMAFAPFSAAVVAPAEIKVDLSRNTLQHVIPSNARLVVEARIRPQDINYVRKDAAAEVRLTSFDARTAPLLHGNVTFVSGDRITPANGREPYFMATVEVDATVLSRHPEIRLQQGMPAELYIKAGKPSTKRGLS
jgi:hypothetical protein